MLHKVRKFVMVFIKSNSIHHPSFGFHLNYANTVWGQNKNSQNCLFLLQKKTFRIISFEGIYAHSNPFFYRPELVELPAKIIIENCLFISESINFDLPSIFNYWFTFSLDFNRYETSCSFKGFLKVNNVNTNLLDKI